MRHISINEPRSHIKTDTIVVNLPSGTKVKVDSFYKLFYEALLDMSDTEKIEFMQVTPFGMQKYMAARQAELNQKLIKLLALPWFYKETGEPVDKHTDLAFDLPSIAVILNHCRAKKKPSLALLEVYIHFFESKEYVYTHDQ